MWDLDCQGDKPILIHFQYKTSTAPIVTTAGGWLIHQQSLSKLELTKALWYRKKCLEDPSTIGKVCTKYGSNIASSEALLVIEGSPKSCASLGTVGTRQAWKLDVLDLLFMAAGHRPCVVGLAVVVGDSWSLAQEACGSEEEEFTKSTRDTVHHSTVLDTS